MSIFGFIILGINIATVFVPLLPEIIESLEHKEGLKDCTQINDKAAAAFNIAGSLGTIIGPILGGALADAYGFTGTCDILASAGVVLGVCYFITAIAPKWL
jgi:MFS family permease